MVESNNLSTLVAYSSGTGVVVLMGVLILNLLHSFMGMIFILGIVGVMIGLSVIIMAVFSRDGYYTHWVYGGRVLTFFSLLTLLWGVIHCVMVSNNIFGL